jgi:hypothetical protein
MSLIPLMVYFGRLEPWPRKQLCGSLKGSLRAGSFVVMIRLVESIDGVSQSWQPKGKAFGGVFFVALKLKLYMSCNHRSTMNWLSIETSSSRPCHVCPSFSFIMGLDLINQGRARVCLQRNLLGGASFSICMCLRERFTRFCGTRDRLMDG